MSSPPPSASPPEGRLSGWTGRNSRLLPPPTTSPRSESASSRSPSRLRGNAATTVAATAKLARLAGIRVFATGGIGGVHRRASETFDESADLGALARTPITVVCAGVKSILDVPATLERLETLGVAVVGYRTSRFPGFYVADSGIDIDWTLCEPEQIVAVMHAADALAITAGIVVANPVPVQHELDPEEHEALLVNALAAAEAQQVRGEAVTPFLLDHFYTASAGASLEANVWAVRNNVALAARIARAWVTSAA